MVKQMFVTEKINASAIRKRMRYTSLRLHPRWRGSIDEEFWWCLFPFSILDHRVVDSSNSNAMFSCPFIMLGVLSRWPSFVGVKEGSPFPVTGHSGSATLALLARFNWGDGATWIFCNLLVLARKTLPEKGFFVTCSFKLWVDILSSRRCCQESSLLFSLNTSAGKFQPLDFSTLDCCKSYFFLFVTLRIMLQRTRDSSEQNTKTMGLNCPEGRKSSRTWLSLVSRCRELQDVFNKVTSTIAMPFFALSPLKWDKDGKQTPPNWLFCYSLRWPLYVSFVWLSDYHVHVNLPRHWQMLSVFNLGSRESGAEEIWQGNNVIVCNWLSLQSKLSSCI